MDVSVIIATYNRGNLLIRLLQQYEKILAVTKYKFEIIFDLEDLGTKENYTEDGRLEYYINVKPVS